MLLTNAGSMPTIRSSSATCWRRCGASVGKITRLLTRLQPDRRERSHALIQPLHRLTGIVEAAAQITGTAVELSR